MEARDYVNALLDLGLTQAVIAEKTGIAQASVSKVARGDVADVLSRNYRKLQALHEETIAAAAAAPAPQPAEQAN